MRKGRRNGQLSTLTLRLGGRDRKTHRLDRLNPRVTLVLPWPTTANDLLSGLFARSCRCGFGGVGPSGGWYGEEGTAEDGSAGSEHRVSRCGWFEVEEEERRLERNFYPATLAGAC